LSNSFFVVISTPVAQAAGVFFGLWIHRSQPLAFEPKLTDER